MPGIRPRNDSGDAQLKAAAARAWTSGTASATARILSRRSVFLSSIARMRRDEDLACAERRESRCAECRASFPGNRHAVEMRRQALVASLQVVKFDVRGCHQAHPELGENCAFVDVLLDDGAQRLVSEHQRFPPACSHVRTHKPS